MLTREGEDRSFTHDRRLACTLAFIAGALNSAGFYAVGVFSANMTGNVSIFADRVAVGDLVAGLFYFAIVLTFVLGAALSTLITSAGKRRRVGSVYALAIVAEGVLLAGLGVSDLWLPLGQREPVLVFGLSFLMGLQNAIVTQISGARVRTTHISGMATDLGIEIGMLIEIASRHGAETKTRPFRQKLGLNAVTILAFCLGGILGVAAYRAYGADLLFAAAALLLTLSVPSLLGSYSERKKAGVPPSRP